MGMDFISGGWTTTRAHKTDIESVNRWIDDLSVLALLGRIDRLDEQGRFDTEVEYDDDLFIVETDEGNIQLAQRLRDSLRYGAQVAFDSDARMSNVWGIPGTTLDFTVMGGGSWGDDPFDGYTDLCMFMEATDIWYELKELTNIVCGGLPSVEVINQHINDEETGA